MITTRSLRRRQLLSGVAIVAATALSGVSAEAGTTVRPTIEVRGPFPDPPTDIAEFMSGAPAPEWAADMDALDAFVRGNYPNPFVNISETEWSARLADLAGRLPGLSAAEATLAISELLAELDGGVTFVLPSSAIAVRLPAWIAEQPSEATDLDTVTSPVRCTAPRPSQCPV